MAREKLLTESEIRRFIKLANMGAVGDAKIEEYGMSSGYAGARDDEGEEFPGDEGPVDVGPAMEDEPAVAELPPPEDMGAEMGVEEESTDEEKALELAVGIADLLDDIYNLEVSVEGEPEEDVEGLEEPEEGDPSAEVPLGLGDTGEPELEGVPGTEDELAGLTEAEIVKVVAKRVADRLVKENRKSEMVEDLTERIFERLTQK